MKNYLFEDAISGERFFVQAESQHEAEDILEENGLSLCDCEFIDVFSDFEAEWMGYDTY